MKEKKETLSEKCNRQTQIIAKQSQSIEALQEQDKSTRRQFTNVLKGRPSSMDYSLSTTETMSWEEIFFQVGTLWARIINSETRDEIDCLRESVNKINEPTTTLQR
jgi:hypothetical protein